MCCPELRTLSRKLIYDDQYAAAGRRCRAVTWSDAGDAAVCDAVAVLASGEQTRWVLLACDPTGRVREMRLSFRRMRVGVAAAVGGWRPCRE